MTIEELKTLKIVDKILYNNNVYTIRCKVQGNKRVVIEKGMQVLEVSRTSLKLIN